MTSDKRIVGICLVRNEERFFDIVLANIIEFCDQIIITDNGSTDQTPEIARRWSFKHPSITFTSIDHPAQSHEMIMPFVNTPTWIFAVDGDELYDPLGLSKLRNGIINGSYDGYWKIIGNVLNCIELDLVTGMASGYLSPPSRSITKLYNFNAIHSWDGVQVERLHGGKISFKRGYQQSCRLRLHEQVSWDESIFRCLHLCFMARSSKDKKPMNGIVTRWNLAEQYNKGLLTFVLAQMFNRLGVSLSSGWKFRKYGRGKVVTRNISQFLNASKESKR